MKIRVRQSQPLSHLAPARENLEAFLAQRPKPATKAQIAGIVRQINVRLGEALEEAKPLGLQLDAGFIHELLNHLLQDATLPSYQLPNDGSVHDYFMEGLFQELTQMPSNVFDLVIATDGTQNYIPLTPETWIAALEAVQILTTKKTIARPIC